MDNITPTARHDHAANRAETFNITDAKRRSHKRKRSDYPFDMGVEDGVRRIEESRLGEADISRLLHGNAAGALFGL